MSFDLFGDQVRERRLQDEQVFAEGFDALAGILEKKLLNQGGTAQVKGAIDEVLLSLGVRPVEAPEDVSDLKGQLEYALRPHGIMRRRVDLSGPWWRSATGAYLGSTSAGRVIAIRQDLLLRYYYRDDEGRKIIINARTAQTIESEAFCFYRPLPAKALSLYDLSLHMARSISRSDLILVVLISLASSLVGLLLPLLNRQLYQSVIPSGLLTNILPMTGLLIGATVGTTLFGVTRTAITSRFMSKINLSVQSAAMMRLLSLPATFFS